MSITFTSSHVRGDFRSGKLDVQIALEDDALGQTRYDAIWFDVPSDFHTHNDSVAAALLTLVGRRYRRVRFNFPISSYCAATLRAHYGLDEVGPVDAGLEPRHRGQFVGLMLSGGLDSLAMWLLLRRVLGEGGFRVVTIDFGERFAFESRGYSVVPRDVTCRTNFRELGYDRSGRFTGSVPLLFADYLDLDTVVTGHHANHPPADLDPPVPSRPPLYLANDPPFLAGGLGELHIARALFVVATPWILVQSDPALLYAGWLGSATDGSSKQFKKGVLLRHLFRRAGKVPPDWLAAPLPRPRQRMRTLAEPETLALTLYLVKHCGAAALRPLFFDINRHDLGYVAEMELAFLDRYNPVVVDRLPDELRAPLHDAFAHYGIAPYEDRDFEEQYRVGALIAAAGARHGRDTRQAG